MHSTYVFKIPLSPSLQKTWSNVTETFHILNFALGKMTVVFLHLYSVKNIYSSVNDCITYANVIFNKLPTRLFFIHFLLLLKYV